MPEWSSPRHPVYAVFAKSGHVPAKVRAFVEYAQALMAGERDAWGITPRRLTVGAGHASGVAPAGPARE
jgi:hypothetical protein